MHLHLHVHLRTCMHVNANVDVHVNVHAANRQPLAAVQLCIIWLLPSNAHTAIWVPPYLKRADHDIDGYPPVHAETRW